MATRAWAELHTQYHELPGESLLCMSGHARHVPEASVALYPGSFSAWKGALVLAKLKPPYILLSVTRSLPCHTIVRLVP